MRLVGSFSRLLQSERHEINTTDRQPWESAHTYPQYPCGARRVSHQSPLTARCSNVIRKKGSVLNIRRGQVLKRGLASTSELSFGPIAFGHYNVFPVVSSYYQPRNLWGNTCPHQSEVMNTSNIGYLGPSSGKLLRRSGLIRSTEGFGPILIPRSHMIVA